MHAAFTERLHILNALRRRLLHGARQQVADGTAVPDVRLALANLQPRQAHPQRVPRSGECDVQQSQMFTLPLLLRHGHLGLGRRQHQFGRATEPRQQQHRVLVAVDLSEVRQERQEHQRVFQALGLVHRDDLDKVGVALQAQHQLVPACAAAYEAGLTILDLLRQPADKRLLAIDLGGGGLQQLGQVQHVRQAPLSRVCRGARVQGQQPRRQVEGMQCSANHGQHALVLPYEIELLKPFALPVEALVFGRQRDQFVQRQPQQRSGEGRTREPHVAWRRHGLQQPQQIDRLVGLKDGVLVGQVHGCQSTPPQRMPYRLGFGARADQHGHIGGPQSPEGPALFGEPRLGVVEHRDDAFRTQGCKPLAAVGGVAQFGVDHGRDGRCIARRRDEPFDSTLGFDRDEGQGRSAVTVAIKPLP